ncbi:MAG: RsmB/NOP family class I SAM-dependent RNA methyltransferase [Deltaproteobacteria bacterium]|nr:RsmB/NOP family class I SAM-dependent RNA methyltransferase [Deltaproteobacteria bacterium]
MTPPRALFRRTVELAAQIFADTGRPADRQIEHFFRKHRDMGRNDRGFVAETVYGLLRQRRLLTALVGGETPAPERLVATYLLESGWTAQALHQAGFEGDAQGLKERLQRFDRTVLPAAVVANLPDSLQALLEPQLPRDELWALTAALNEPATVDLRVNTLKASRNDVALRLGREGFAAEQTPYSPVGLRRHDRAPLFGLQAFKDGLFEVQDEASQLVGLLVEPRRGERIVDFCAGAGGKTLHLGALMSNTGTLYAFDTSAKRLGQLRPRLERTGLSNIRPIVIVAGRDQHVRRLMDKIDRVLVDAPCSGTGTLRRNPDIKWRPLDLAVLVQTQKDILASAARLVKPSGRLVYSTCSLLRQENEEVVAAFLAAAPQFQRVAVDEILRRRHLRIPDAVTPVGELRLYPHRHGTDGFFAAVLERRE